ncbi:MAG TPA: DUF2169 domain-containing protein, partial [Minicystis sp.]|nr:DUF2169 domain-containing protein [Minicystis sp.]
MELVSHAPDHAASHGAAPRVAPVAAAIVTWSRTGAPSSTLVCKLTFELTPGAARLAAAPLPIVERDEHEGGSPTASVSSPSDLAPFKPRADVVLVGSAYAPGGQPVRSLVARLGVAGIEKAIEVHCDRVLAPNGKVLDGPWF